MKQRMSISTESFVVAGWAKPGAIKCVEANEGYVHLDVMLPVQDIISIIDDDDNLYSGCSKHLGVRKIKQAIEQLNNPPKEDEYILTMPRA